MTERLMGLAGRLTLRFLWDRNGAAEPGRRDRSAEGPLVAWPEGDEGEIVEVAGTSFLTARLREVGAVPGARVRVLRAGCPTVIQVEEGRFCVRRRDTDTIRVRSV